MFSLVKLTKYFSLNRIKYKTARLFDKIQAFFVIHNNFDEKINKIQLDFLINNKTFAQKIIEKAKEGSGKDFNLGLEHDLNTNIFDFALQDIVLSYFKAEKSFFSTLKVAKNNISARKRIGVLFTQNYDVGGHSVVLERFVESMATELPIFIYQTKRSAYFSQKIKNIAKIKNLGWQFESKKPTFYIKKLYKNILSDNVDILMVYIHPQDIIGASVMALIKENFPEKIKIIYVNLADHRRNFGYNFASLIIDERPSSQFINQRFRGLFNSVIMPLQQKRSSDTHYYSQKEIVDFRKKIAVADSEILLLSGGASYKFFDDKDSDYFKVICSILEHRSQVKLLIMSDIKEEQKELIGEIFKNKEQLLSRIIFADFVTDYDLSMQSCDIFVDSFPQGGALIHLDIMRNRKPTVLKINLANNIQSFETFLPQYYRWQFSDLPSLTAGVIDLIDSKSLRDNASDVLFQHFLDNFEFTVVKNKYLQLFSDLEDLPNIFGKNYFS
jgi:hypothetical protein